MLERSVEKELIELERRYWEAVKNTDTNTVMRLSDDPCFVTGPQGISRIRRDNFQKIMQAMTFTLHEFELQQPEVCLLSDDAAIVAYKVHQELTVDGERVSLDAADTSTWVKRNGRWLCALHTESPTGDPFGRDRR